MTPVSRTDNLYSGPVSYRPLTAVAPQVVPSYARKYHNSGSIGN